MRGDELLDRMDLIDIAYVEAADMRPMRKRTSRLRWTAAACLAIAVIVGLVAIVLDGKPNDPTQGKLTPSERTTATIAYGVPKEATPGKGVYSLISYTETETFALEDLYVFRGIVRDLSNLTIDFGESTTYCCIAAIDITKVYKGNLQRGDRIKMLLPFPVGIEGWYQENCDALTSIEVGMEGIFMPWAYDDSARWEMGKTVMLQDLAACGLPDGHGWAFLYDGTRLIYDSASYPGAYGATTLDDIQEYVTKMIESSDN